MVTSALDSLSGGNPVNTSSSSSKESVGLSSLVALNSTAPANVINKPISNTGGGVAALAAASSSSTTSVAGAGAAAGAKAPQPQMQQQHAISYVTAIRNRFAVEPETYR